MHLTPQNTNILFSVVPFIHLNPEPTTNIKYFIMFVGAKVINISNYIMS